MAEAKQKQHDARWQRLVESELLRGKDLMRSARLPAEARPLRRS